MVTSVAVHAASSPKRTGVVRSMIAPLAHRPGRRRRAGPIGVDLALTRLNLVQVGLTPNGPRPSAWASMPFPDSREALLADPRAFKALVRSALAEGRFGGRRAVAAMPADRLKLVHIEYRLEPGRAEGLTVLDHALGRLDGDASDWIVDFLPVRVPGDDEDRRAAMVACARRPEVLELLESFRRAGLEVEALEIGPVALRRLITGTAADAESEHVLAVNVGRSRSYLSVYSGRRLILDRELDFGDSPLIAHIAAELQLDVDAASALVRRYGVAGAGAVEEAERDVEAEAIRATLGEIVQPRFIELSDEVGKAVLYTAARARGARVERLHLLGGLAQWPGADRFLQDLLSMPVAVLDPFAAMGGVEHEEAWPRGPAAVGYAVAAGCALRGLDADG